MIQIRLKVYLQKVRREGVLRVEEEINLTSCISKLSKLGFAMTLSDTEKLLGNHVAVNKYQRGKKIFKHEGRI